MLEMGTSGLMSGEGKRVASSKVGYRALPRLYAGAFASVLIAREYVARDFVAPHTVGFAENGVSLTGSIPGLCSETTSIRALKRTHWKTPSRVPVPPPLPGDKASVVVKHAPPLLRSLILPKKI
jgi:hypothetical protein